MKNEMKVKNWKPQKVNPSRYNVIMQLIVIMRVKRKQIKVHREGSRAEKNKQHSNHKL